MKTDVYRILILSVLSTFSLMALNGCGSVSPAIGQEEESVPSSMSAPEGSVPFTPFEEEWLLNGSADPGVSVPSAWVVRSLDDLRDLPLNPADYSLDAFTNFNFDERALVFLIHPQQTSSSYEFRVKRLVPSAEVLLLDAIYITPGPNCMITDDISWIGDVVSVPQSSVIDVPAGSRPVIRTQSEQLDCEA